MNKLVASFLLIIFLTVALIARPVLANITPNDPYYDHQWYLTKIKADSAWDKISASPDMVIAVIDSGIQINHPDLRGNIWENKKEIIDNKLDDDRNGFIDDFNGWDFVSGTPDPAPKFAADWTEAGVSHGTMVAGIIAANGNNNEGIAGVTWRAKIMPLKVLNDKGEGKTSDVIRAIDYAVNNGADIINLSFVSFIYSEALQDAVRRAYQAGVIIVAAAGNEQSAGQGYNIDTTPVYPACYDNRLGENMVIGVAATDALDQKAAFSSYGKNCVDIAAPGISFFSTVTAGGNPEDSEKIYDGYWSGTSMAAPLVSAALALIAQANPELSRSEILNILFTSADNITRLNPDYSGLLGSGRLNINQAIEAAKKNLYKRVSRLILSPVLGGPTVGDREVKITAVNGNLVKDIKIPDFKKGFNFTTGDLNGDGEEEFILMAKTGFEPRIKIFDQNGSLLKEFLAFDRNFRGGVNAVLADLDNDGTTEIIATQASAGNSQIKIFNADGKLKKQFLAVNNRWYGGLEVAVGNLDGQGNQEIIVGFAAGREPQIRIFTSEGRVTSIFLAYEKNFRGGVKIAAANLDGRRDRGKDEIIVAPGKGREPLIKIFDHRAQIKKQFLAYGRSWQGGMDLGVDDLNNDGSAEIVVGAQPGAAPHVRTFDGQGVLQESFYVWEEGFNGGVNVDIMKVNN